MNKVIVLNHKNSFQKRSKRTKESFTLYKNKFLIRSFDFLFAFFALFVLSPIILMIALTLKIKSPNGEIFFKQKRLGLDHKLFDVYKFRTMIPNAEERLKELLNSDETLKNEYLTYRKLKSDPRIIPHIGDFLRKTSLDELPQFFNVLRGEMSIVGPRPYIENEFDVFQTELELETVTAVKPGITGYWQVIPERHETTFESRVETDMEYIKKKNFMLDLKIIGQTLSVMALKKGA